MAAKLAVAPDGGSSANSQKTRALLRVVILIFIAAAGVSSRLFSVIRAPTPLQLTRRRLGEMC
jgi:hypothetical protein